MAKKKGHPGTRAFAGSLAGATVGGAAGALAGVPAGPAGVTAGSALGEYAGALVGGDLASKQYASKHNLSPEATKDVRQGTAIGNAILPVAGGALAAHVMAPNVEEPRRKMQAGSAGIASYHAEKDIARMRSARHPSYYTRRQHGKLQRVKYSYRDSRNPFNNEF